MIRSFFLAIGLFVVILGAEFAVVDEIVWTREAAVDSHGQVAMMSSGEQRTTKTDAHWPWLYAAVGTVIVLYSCTIKKGGKK